MKKHFIFVIIFCIACFTGFAQSSITIEPTTSNQLKLRGNGNGGYWPSIVGYRSLGTSVAPAAVQSGNWLLSIDGLGYTGSGYSNSVLGATGAIQIVAAENFTPTATGTLIRFSTTTNGTVVAPTERMRINHNGNVGIGNTNPTTAKLVIGGTAGSQGLDLSTSDQYANVRVLQNTNGTADKDIYLGYGSGATSSLHLYSNNSEVMTVKNDKVGIRYTDPHAPLQFDNSFTTPRKIVLFEQANNDNQFDGFGVNNGYMNYQIANTNDSHVFFAGASPTTSNELMRIKGNGNVGIGTNNPVNKLEVFGTIRARELIIETTWADYVFEDDFKLKPLNEVAKFIKENKHLPDVPSAKYLQDNGGPVSELMTKMMQKIEELTLYSIQQENKIEALEKRLDEKK